MSAPSEESKNPYQLAMQNFEKAADLVKAPIADKTGQSFYVDEDLGAANSTERRIRELALRRIHQCQLQVPRAELETEEVARQPAIIGRDDDARGMGVLLCLLVPRVAESGGVGHPTDFRFCARQEVPGARRGFGGPVFEVRLLLLGRDGRGVARVEADQITPLPPVAIVTASDANERISMVRRFWATIPRHRPSSSFTIPKKSQPSNF